VIQGTHNDVVNRLKRAEGHIRTIVEMIEANRECLDVAQQLQAVEKAIQNAKKIYVQITLTTALRTLPA
jgi:DNA-binding FrmR family transcriptional regulator